MVHLIVRISLFLLCASIPSCTQAAITSADLAVDPHTGFFHEPDNYQLTGINFGYALNNNAFSLPGGVGTAATYNFATGLLAHFTNNGNPIDNFTWFTPVWNLAGTDKTLPGCGLSPVLASNTTPIIEVLYAWHGYDQFEAVDMSSGGPAPAVSNAASYVDVTAKVQAALTAGGSGIYINKNRPMPLYEGGHGVLGDGFIPKQTLITADGSGMDSTHIAYLLATKVTAPTFSAISSFSSAWPVSAPTSVSNVTATSNTSSLGIVYYGGGATGIVYRDANGIHFRRFESWQNISLPMVASYTVNPGNNSNYGAWFYNHQFEELGRGLVTMTVNGSAPLHFLATDRFGWLNTTLSNTVSDPGIVLPPEAVGPDLMLIHAMVKGDNTDPQATPFGQVRSLDHFRCTYDSSGLNISCKPGGYGYGYAMTQGGQVSGEDTTKCCVFGRDRTAMNFYLNTSKNYVFYDENNNPQTIPVAAQFDTKTLTYPGGTQNLWFAFDYAPDTGSIFYAGIGTPKNSADFGSTSCPILYQSTSAVPVSRFLRNFTFTTAPAPGSTSTSTSSLSVSNVQSLFFNPAQKFCTPPYMDGRFLHWLSQWTIPNPNLFTLQFNAKGNTIAVALGNKTTAARTPTASSGAGSTFDTSGNYSIIITKTGVTINKLTGSSSGAIKQTATPLPNTTTGVTTFLGGTDMTQYYPYWITFTNGTITVGQSATPGRNVIGTAKDPSWTSSGSVQLVSYCLSGGLQPVDYTGISCTGTGQLQETTDTVTSSTGAQTTTAGAYKWSNTNIFPQSGSGTILFSYQAAAPATPSDSSATTPVDPTVIVGLANATGSGSTIDTSKLSTTAQPPYQVQCGLQQGLAGQIWQGATKQQSFTSPTFDANNNPVPYIVQDGAWHRMWLVYDSGGIAFGTGTTVGQNIISMWQDPNGLTSTTARTINAFALTSPSPNVQLRLDSIYTAAQQPLQRNFTLQPNTTAISQPLWYFTTPNNGALLLTAATTSARSSGTITSGSAALHIGFTSTTRALSNGPIYEVVIGDNGTAYVQKEGVQQAGSIVSLTAAQLPPSASTSSAPQEYWAAFKNGVIIAGTGKDPLNQASFILQWQDSTFNATTSTPINCFSLAAFNQPLSIQGATTAVTTQFDSVISSLAASLQAQATLVSTWNTNKGASINLTPTQSQQLFWHQANKFNQPGSTTFSYTIQKQTTTPVKYYIGLIDTLPAQTATTLAGARYYITFSENGALSIIDTVAAKQPTTQGSLPGALPLYDGNGNSLGTTASLTTLKNLSSTSTHTVWVNVATTTAAGSTSGSIKISLGVDAAPGANPLCVCTIPMPSTPLMLNYVGVGADACTVALSSLANALLTDPTTYTTLDSEKFVWQQTWSFGSPDMEQISFVAKKASGETRPFSLIIGLGLAGALRDTMSSATPAFNNIQYAVMIDSTGQIGLFKSPDFSSEIATIRYTDPATISSVGSSTATTMQNLINGLVNGTTPILCHLAYAQGMLQFAISSDTTAANLKNVWSYTDPSPTTGITQFSFSSLQSTTQLTNIMTLGGESLLNMQTMFGSLLTMLATKPTSIAGLMSTTVTQQLYSTNVDYFINSVVNVLLAHRELLSTADQTTIANLIQTVAASPSATSAQQRTLQAAASTMATALDYAGTIIPGYIAQIPTIFGTSTTGSATTTALAQTHPTRVLFLYSLNQLATLPSATLNLPGVLSAIDSLVDAMPTATGVLSSTEQAAVAALSHLAGNSAILANIQDPNAMFTLIMTPGAVLDYNAQISAISGLLTARHNSIGTVQSNASTVVPAFTPAQGQNIIAIIASVTANRDKLTAAGLQNLALAIQTANSIPELQALTTGTPAQTWAQLLTLASTPPNFTQQVAWFVSQITPPAPANGATAATSVLSLPSTSQQRQLFFQYLGALPTSTNTKSAADLATFNSGVITPLQNTVLAATETPILTALVTMISNALQPATLITQTQDPSLILGYIASNLILDYNLQIQGLLNLLNARITTTPTPGNTGATLPTTSTTPLFTFSTTITVPPTATANQANLPSQAQALMNDLAVITYNRDKLSSAGLKNLTQALQVANTVPELLNLTGVYPSTVLNTASGSTASQTAQPSQAYTISQLLTLAGQPADFHAQAVWFANNVNTIIPRQSTDTLRTLFFSYLAALPNSTNTKTIADLNLLSTAVVQPLQKVTLSNTESAAVSGVTTMLTSASQTAQSFSAQLQAAQTSITTLGGKSGYIAFLTNALQTMGVSTLFQTADYDNFIAQLEYVVYSRELIQPTTSNGSITQLTTASTTPASTTSTSADLANLITLIEMTQSLPQFSTYQQTLATLLSTAQSPYAFADRIAYMATEVASIEAANQNQPGPSPTSVAQSSTPTAPAMPAVVQGTPNYFYNRLVQKIGLITTAPGAQTSALYNTLNLSVIAPLLAMGTDQTQVGQLTTYNTAITNNKQSMLAAQGYFWYQYASALAQPAYPRTTLVQALSTIITGQIQGTVTFYPSGSANAYDQTAAHLADAQVFLNALTTLVNERELLNSSDFTTLVNTINAAMTSTLYSSNQQSLQALQVLLNQANTPQPFATLLQKYSPLTTSIRTLQATDPNRMLFFQGLQALATAPGAQTAADMATVQTSIVTPLNAITLSPTESNIVAALSSMNNRMQTATYQLAQLCQQNSWSSYIGGLQAMLANQGASVQFAAADYETFYQNLVILVNNRELIQADTNGAAEVEALGTLLATAQSTPGLMTNHQTDIANLITTLGQPHLFADRVTYALAEIQQLQNAQQSNGGVLPTTMQYLITRLVNQLSIILNAPGITSTQTLATLQTQVINPLMALTTNQQFLASLQTITQNVTRMVQTVQQQQAYFGFNYTSAIAAGSTPSSQINAFFAIIKGQIGGTITFYPAGNQNAYDQTATQLSDAQVFLNGLTAIANTRELLSSADFTTLVNTINATLTSSAYTDNSQLMQALQSLLTQVNTPQQFEALLQKYSALAASIRTLQPNDPKRVTFFQGLQALAAASGPQTTANMTTLQSTIITPLSAMTLQPAEQAIISALSAIVSKMQTATTQLAQLAQVNTWALYISGLQTMLANQGASVQFATADYETFYQNLVILVNNRELIQADPNSAAEIQALTTLLNTAAVTPGLANHQTDIAALINTLSTPHLFADRVAYLVSEMQQIQAAVQAATTNAGNTTTTPQIPANMSYLGTRIINQLNLILSAPGLMTSALFSTLQTKVINPLLGFYANNQAVLPTLQTLVQSITQQAQVVMQQQGYFAFNFTAALAQSGTMSAYISALESIMQGAQQGSITFYPAGNKNAYDQTSTQLSDAQVFLNALSSIVTNMLDCLAPTDLANLNQTLTLALNSPLYASSTQATTTIQGLLTNASTPVFFADRVTKYAGETTAIAALASTNTRRMLFFTGLQGLLNAPGQMTQATLNSVQQNILPMFASTTNANEQKILSSVQNFISQSLTMVTTAAYNINALNTYTADITEFVNGLTTLYSQAGSYYTFTNADMQNLVNDLTYLVYSRELLDNNSTLTTAIAQLISTVANDPNYSTYATTLNTLLSTLQQPYYFIDRVNFMASEAQALVAIKATAVNGMLIRLLQKLALLSNAPTQNMTIVPFNTLQANVIGQLNTLALTTSQQTALSGLLAQNSALSLLKQQIVASAGTFTYAYNIAQSYINPPTNSTAPDYTSYISQLTTIVNSKQNNTLTFGPQDPTTLLTALTALINNRDALTTAQVTAVKSLLSLCLYSSMYKDATSQATLRELATQLMTPLPLSTLLPKYLGMLPTIMYLPAGNPNRSAFFTMLNNMTQATTDVTQQLAGQISNTLIPALQSMPSLKPAETQVITALQGFIQTVQQKMQSVSYLLQTADTTNLSLAAYATAVAQIAVLKNNPLAFSATDDTNVIGALAYVVASRELLTGPQDAATVNAALTQVQSTGQFTAQATQITQLISTLPAPYLFAARVAYMKAELASLTAANVSPSSNRMIRFVQKFTTLIGAQGPAQASDFATIQTMLTQLQGMTGLPAAQQQIVSSVLAQVASQQTAILEQQSTFAYVYAQAQTYLTQTPVDYTSYVNALQNIIVQYRQTNAQGAPLLTFTSGDYATFVQALVSIGAQRDALTSANLQTLQNTINYTYYASGFNNPQFQNTLNTLYTSLSTPVLLSTRITQYTKQISQIITLDSSNQTRITFFSMLSLLPNLASTAQLIDLQNLNNNIITPLQTKPLSSNEQATLTALQQWITQLQPQLSSLTYNLNYISTLITNAMQSVTTNNLTINLGDATLDPTAITINGLTNIMNYVAQGTVTLGTDDYETLFTLLSNLVTNRELLTTSEITQVQSLARAMQSNSGFAQFSSQLATAVTTVTTPYTFVQRAKKYIAGFSQANSAPTADPNKQLYVMMVSSIFATTSDDPDPATLSNFTTQVVNAIGSGNFSTAQKALVSPLVMQCAAEATKIASFSFRLTAAQASTTPEAYYTALAQMLTDSTTISPTTNAPILAMASADYTTFVNTVNTLVGLRPLVPNPQSALLTLVQALSTNSTITGRADLMPTVTSMAAALQTNVDPAARATYLSTTIASALNQATTSGDRAQFFVRLSTFTTELQSLYAATPTVVLSEMTQLQTFVQSLPQYATNQNAQPSEQTTINGAYRSLSDYLSTLQTAAPTPITSIPVAPQQGASGAVSGLPAAPAINPLPTIVRKSPVPLTHFQ